jgi:nitrogen fixation protein FixH
MTTATARSAWIPWIFVGSFLLVVAANATMIAFALSSFTGLTTSEPYTKGLRFNDQIRQAQQQERLGWSVRARFDKSAVGQSGALEVQLADRGGAVLLGAHVAATFLRPLEKRHDFAVTFTPTGSGRYVARVEFPLSGAWDVRYTIAHQGSSLEARDRLEVE